MRIIFVNRFFYPDHSATSQLLSDLAFKCVEWGFDVKVVTSRQRYDDPSIRLPESEKVGGVDIIRVSGTHYGRHSGAARLLDYISFLHGARKKVKGIVEPGTIVVAKTDPPMLGMFLGSVVRGRGGILVNWLQDVFPETLTALHPSPVLSLALAPLRFFRNASLKKAGVNVVIGRKMRDYLLSEGLRAGRVGVIRNWPYEETSDAVAGAEDLKEQWGLAGRFVVGYFGNLGRVHEYETILGAMMAVESDPSIVFLFVGGGSLLEKLKAEVEKHGLGNFIHRDYVPREELPAALRVADAHLVVLQPSLEGFVVPSKFAGVVAAGRPVLYVGDTRGEIGGMVLKGRCGQVVQIGDSQGLAAIIRDLADHPLTVARMGQAADRVYQKYFRRDLLFGQWRKVLAKLVNRFS